MTGILHRIRRSITQGPLVPQTDQERKRFVVQNFILHFRPVRLPAKALRWTHTFGLGGMGLVLALVLMGTGVLMMFVYEPSPDRAYESILRLQRDVAFGQLIRNVHHWSANLLIAVAALHLLRVYFTGAYHPPRQFNWVIGLSLLLCIVVQNFTGYLLPWDQLSYWAVTISTGMVGYVPLVGTWVQEVIRGGPEIGRATLLTFYAFHTTVVPALLVGFMAWHFWRVRKARGVVVPRGPEEEPSGDLERVLTVPHLLVREVVVGLVLVGVILVLSLIANAPLADAANPGMSPNPAKAPWYFVGIQELLLHFHPLLAVLVLPLVAVMGLLLIPYVLYERDTSGVFMMSHKGRQMAAIAAVTALLATPVWIVLDEYWIDLAAWLPIVPLSVSTGLIPAAVLLAAIWGFFTALKKRFSTSNDEAIQACFVLVLVGFAVLTMTGVWFRGPGMALVWP